MTRARWSRTAVAVTMLAVPLLACTDDAPAGQTDEHPPDAEAAGQDTVETEPIDEDGGAPPASPGTVELATTGEVTVPTGFPDSMPLPRGATSAVTEDDTVAGVTLNHPGESAALIAFYEEQLAAYGWSFQDQPTVADNPMLTDGVRMWDVTGNGHTGWMVITDQLAGPETRVVMIMIDR